MEEGALQVSHKEYVGFERLETSHLAGWLDSKRQKIGEDVEEVGPLCTVSRNAQ